MCILLTPVLYFITTAVIEVYLQCFTELVRLRDIGKPTSRIKISSPNSLYFKAEKGAHLGSILTGVTSELTYTSLIYDTLFNPLSNTLFEFLNGVCSEIQRSDRQGKFRKSSFEFLNRLASTLKAIALQSRQKSVNKIA